MNKKFNKLKALLKLKQGTIKEFGKLIYDLTKISFGIVLLTPFVKGEDVSIYIFLILGIGVILGTIFINKGEN